MATSGPPNGTSRPTTARSVSIAAPPPPPSIYEASSISSIRATLASLHERETSITTRLNSLISAQTSLSRDLGRLDLLRAHLGTQVINTRAISHCMLDSAADTAAGLSGKVKDLDLEKKRVEETLGVVEQVAELKACVQGVVGSMGAPQDWEAAAGYIARAERVPRSIVEGGFATRVVPSVEVPDAPGVTLENAKESLCGLFLREFEKAAAEGDGTKVTRFFKLFPLIGRSEVGLDVYGRYVCQGVSGTARRNLKEGTGGQQRKDGYFYANALTKLFEHIAQIVEGHGGLVERHYGAGKMIRVMERLQMEADVQGGIILDTWGDERNVDRRLTDVKSYPFSFLVQSFLQAQKGSSGTPRTSSPAQNGSAGRASEDEGVDMKEIDGLLGETAVMLGRWALYSRFLGGKCKDPTSPADSPLEMPEFLLKSALSRKISTLLTTPFNLMTTFFFRRSVEKAFQLDEPPTGLSLNPNKALDVNPPYIISAVDDVMYIVNTVLQRALSTSTRDVIASVVPTISRVLGSDFVGMIQRKMRDESYPKPVIQGGFPPEDKIIAFIVLLNSLDVSNDYISRIVSSRLEAFNNAESATSLQTTFPFDHDAVFVQTTITNLQSSFADKTSDLVNEALTILFGHVIKPRLSPVLRDTFRDADYSLTDDELAELARQLNEDNDYSAVDAQETLKDLVPRRFEHSWNMLMKPLQRLLTSRLFNSVLEQTAKYLARVLEKRIWNAAGKVNALGAVRMERDYSGIVGVVARGGRWEVRGAFARCLQVLMVVNMEEEEWEDVRDGSSGSGDEEGGVEWVLSAEERERARGIVR